MEPDSSSPRSIINGGGMRAVTVDEVHGFVYWNDYGTVRRARLDGSNTTFIYQSAGGWVFGLAVDPEEGKLYMSDTSDKKILVTSLDGSERRTLINCTGRPQGLTVDLNNRLLLFSTYGPNGIYKARLDGSEPTRIVSTGLTYVYGLDIDYSSSRICWTDEWLRHVECSNYAGGDRRVVYNTSGYPHGIAIQDGVAYYATYNPNRVSSFQLRGGSATILNTGTYSTTLFNDIAILHRDHHPGMRE